MPIVYHQDTKTFHLYNKEMSYIIKILKSNHLGNLYYGKVIKDRPNFDHLLETQARPMAVIIDEKDPTYSLEHMKQECPVYGSGDMRYPAVDIIQTNGSKIVHFVYQSHRIFPGKPGLEDLPATYVEKDSEATTLQITLYDEVIQTKIILSYTIYEDTGVLTRNMYIENIGTSPILLNHIMSMSLDLPDKQYQMIELTGAWARERAVKERVLEHGIQSIASLRGCSSSNFNPFIALKREGCNEYTGEVLGFSLVYSGNFLAQIEVDTYEVTRVMMGIHPHGFSWTLLPNSHFQTPEVVMVYSDKGLNGMSITYHQLYQKRLVRGNYRDQVRPIVINNWEATYFHFDEAKILRLASAAKKLGVEVFVLDDGWFGNRNNDSKGLGDWYPNLEKLPDGIIGLSKKIHDMGMQFGLWFEPEMVNKDSHLYTLHPDWILQTPNRPSSPSRHQYVLDFSNDKVVDYIYEQMKEVIQKSYITYIKWDMNRCMSEVYSSVHSASNQGKVMHEYMLGVYRLYQRLIDTFPTILFESCASGGARFDPGMLYYAPLCWTSDNTDAIERLKIQYGTSFVYPLSSMATHVSSIPNHQVYRNTPLQTRANVAYFGTFGYELDVTKLSKEEQIEVSKQISFMKTYRAVIQHGTFYRLQSPFVSKETIWMVVSPDKNIALIGYYRPLQEINQGYRRIRLLGLDASKEYYDTYHQTYHYGDELMHVGLITSDSTSGRNYNKQGDYVSRIYILKAT